MKKECKIIQDLLPQYIDNYLSEKSNIMVEKHLYDCNKCKKEMKRLQKIMDINMSQEDYKKEILRLRKKIKIVKTTLISLIIIFLVFFIGRFEYTYINLKKMLEHNVDYDIRNNYKRTVTVNGKQSVCYYKDGAYKVIHYGNNSIMWVKDNKGYIINTDSKIYYDYLPITLEKADYSKLYNLEYFMVSREDINFKNIASLILLENTKVGKEEYKNNRYITITIGESKYWINPDTFFVEKEKNDWQITETTIETGNVTDKDIEIPDLTGYKLIENK